jgi:hypothetical protein
MNSSSSSHSSKVNKSHSKDLADFVTINEKVNLTKDQHEVLNIICKTYQILNNSDGFSFNVGLKSIHL